MAQVKILNWLDSAVLKSSTLTTIINLSGMHVKLKLMTLTSEFHVHDANLKFSTDSPYTARTYYPTSYIFYHFSHIMTAMADLSVGS